MSDTTKENIFENKNIVNEYFPEESIESKIRGHQDQINQLQRMIEASDDEIMKDIFHENIENEKKEIELLENKLKNNTSRVG